jgi:hypothetical protein
MLGFQFGFLLTCLRQQILTLPHTLPRHLQGKSEQEMAAVIRNQLHQMLNQLATWPGRISDPDWVSKIDSDFQPSEEESESAPESMSPAKLRTKRQAVERQKERRRLKKLRA